MPCWLAVANAGTTGHSRARYESRDGNATTVEQCVVESHYDDGLASIPSWLLSKYGSSVAHHAGFRAVVHFGQRTAIQASSITRDRADTGDHVIINWDEWVLASKNRANACTNLVVGVSV
jgi:hypothetical protein